MSAIVHSHSWFPYYGKTHCQYAALYPTFPLVLAMTFSDPTYPLFPIFAFLGFFIVLIPLPWHLQAWNSGTCIFMIWTAIGCLNQFINSIVWHGNFTDWAPLWCDICKSGTRLVFQLWFLITLRSQASRLMVGISVAIPAASLCINRRLHKIATCRTPNSFAHVREWNFPKSGSLMNIWQKKRAIFMDLAIALGIPALQMVLRMFSLIPNVLLIQIRS